LKPTLSVHIFGNTCDIYLFSASDELLNEGWLENCR